MTVLEELTAKGVSDIGLVRKTNQDAYWLDATLGLFIVADGMGGHAGGEIAASLCVETIRDRVVGEWAGKKLRKEKSSDILTKLAAAVNLASARIFARAAAEPALHGMGTTATVVLVRGGQAFCAHVGDSRLYLYRAGVLSQKSTDHSLVGEQVQAGVLSPAEARNHQLRNVVTRCVGYKEQERVDTLNFSLEADDILILCSDGLHGKVEDEEIAATIGKAGIDGVDALNALAKARGGSDNITIILAKFSSAAPKG